MYQLGTVMANENQSFQHLCQIFKSKKFKDNFMSHATDTKRSWRAQRHTFDDLPLSILSRKM